MDTSTDMYPKIFIGQELMDKKMQEAEEACATIYTIRKVDEYTKYADRIFQTPSDLGDVYLHLPNPTKALCGALIIPVAETKLNLIILGGRDRVPDELLFLCSTIESSKKENSRTYAALRNAQVSRNVYRKLRILLD
ncbi:MAG: hypothetical protein HN337_01690 [Deltaproteobacteria bacterium]|jgi:hypothetical protein|nr:hypothetical protein [Deltaproteobacteria bacterium]